MQAREEFIGQTLMGLCLDFTATASRSTISQGGGTRGQQGVREQVSGACTKSTQSLRAAGKKEAAILGSAQSM